MIEDSTGARIPADLYEVDRELGIVTMATPLDLSAYEAPFAIKHTIADLSRVRDTDINGTVTFLRPVSHAYPANESYLSGMLYLGTLQARVSDMFEQTTWTGVWQDTRIGDQPLASYNSAAFPIAVTNAGAYKDRISGQVHLGHGLPGHRREHGPDRHRGHQHQLRADQPADRAAVLQDRLSGLGRRLGDGQLPALQSARGQLPGRPGEGRPAIEPDRRIGLRGIAARGERRRMKADTSVKFFSYLHSGAPTLNGVAGSLIDVLDACLVNGFGAVTVSTLSVASEVATVTVSTGHDLEMVGVNTGPVISVSGATPASLNDEWRIDTVPSATQFTFRCPGRSDGSATGTISVKRAPAGWEKDSPVRTKPRTGRHRGIGAGTQAVPVR